MLFLYGVRQGSNFIVSTCITLLSQYHLLNRPFLLSCSAMPPHVFHLLEIQESGNEPCSFLGFWRPQIRSHLAFDFVILVTAVR